MILKDTATFQVLFIVSLYSVLGTSLLWRSTVSFTYLKVKSAKCLCLLPVVLVVFYWSWSWSCKQRSWSWSCYFGLGLKNLVLFTSLSLLLHKCNTRLVCCTVSADTFDVYISEYFQLVVRFGLGLLTFCLCGFVTIPATSTNVNRLLRNFRHILDPSAEFFQKSRWIVQNFS